jgi:hypothetical protein
MLLERQVKPTQGHARNRGKLFNPQRLLKLPREVIQAPRKTRMCDYTSHHHRSSSAFTPSER